MFGHRDESNLPEPDGSSAPDATSTTAPQVTDTAGDYIDDAPVGNDTTTVSPSDDQADAGLGADTSTADPAVVAPAAEPAASTTAPAAPAAAPADTDKLLDIKQQALQQLTPLVGHLEQSPEEKFRTTMMMIQASDNHTLVPAAYEAAGQITDEKARAQALLDIVNEINYFTHNGEAAAA